MGWLESYSRVVGYKFFALGVSLLAFIAYEISGWLGVIVLAVVAWLLYSRPWRKLPEPRYVHYCYKCGTILVEDNECHLWCPKCDADELPQVQLRT